LLNDFESNNFQESILTLEQYVDEVFIYDCKWLESELEDINERWLNPKQKHFYFFYKAKFNYAKVILKKIDYVKFIENLQELYFNFFSLINDANYIWNKFYLYRRTLFAINHTFLNIQSINLLYKSLWLVEYISNKQYLENSHNIDIYEGDEFDYVFFWVTKYSTITKIKIDYIDDLLSNNKSSLVSLFNTLLFLINNNDRERYYKILEKIDKEFLTSLSWLEDSYILHWISILYYEYKIAENKICKNNILLTIILLAKNIPQVWNTNFITLIYNEFINNNADIDFKQKSEEVYKYIISKNEIDQLITIIDKDSNYNLFLDKDEFNIKNFSILKKIISKIWWKKI
jgi:hypothetical protein